MEGLQLLDESTTATTTSSRNTKSTSSNSSTCCVGVACQAAKSMCCEDAVTEMRLVAAEGYEQLGQLEEALQVKVRRVSSALTESSM